MFLRTLKSKIGYFIRQIRPLKQHLANTAYDFARFRNYSAYREQNEIDKLIPLLQWYTHIIEKGLSLEKTRLFFGKAVIADIEHFLMHIEKLGGKKNVPEIQCCLDVLTAYVLFNQTHASEELLKENETYLEHISGLVKKYRSSEHTICKGGTLTFTRSKYMDDARQPWSFLSASRFSVRHYTGQPIPKEDICKAVQWAMKSPSVCNRQSTRLKIIYNKEKIRQVLSLQKGTGGFTDTIGALIMVAGDLKSFSSPHERNQVFIDNGIFCMNLLYGLQYLGYGTCPLHWFWGKEHDLKLRKLIQFPENWTVSCFISVGCLPDEFSVPMGYRKELSEICFFEEEESQ